MSTINTLNIATALNFVDTDFNVLFDGKEKLFKLQHFQGFHQSLRILRSAVPVAQTGDWAFVGNRELPAVHYSGEWLTPRLLNSTENAALNIFADEGQAHAPPKTSPFKYDEGWYFKNSAGLLDPQGNPTTKINWYISDGGYNRATANLETLGAVFDFHQIPSSGDLFFQVYTKMKNDGNDAGSWYRTRLTYLIEPSSVGEFFVHLGVDIPEVAPDLTRLPISSTPSSVLGQNDADEEILFISVGTNSAALADSVEFTLNSSFELYSGDCVSNINVYRR